MIVRIVALAFLLSLFGAVSYHYRFFPGSFFQDSFIALDSLTRQYELNSSANRAGLDQPARSAERGVTINEPEAFQGYTLTVSTHEPVVRLIDMNGQAVHSWQVDYRSVWEEVESSVSQPVRDELIYIRSVYLLPNGELLIQLSGAGQTPWGYGLIKVDKDSNVLWADLRHFHHALDVGDDGRVYALEHAINPDGQKLARFMKGRATIDDYVVVFDKSGKQLQRVDVFAAFRDSDFKAVIWSHLRASAGRDDGDLFHTNDVEVLSPAMAPLFPMAQAGDVMISMREINMLAIIDMKQGKVRWVVTGLWTGQHDPDFLPNGNILLFDNAYPEKGFDGFIHRSRLVEFNPQSMAVAWMYEGSAEQPFASSIRSEVQKLGNGNVLVTESERGRIFEVNPAGELVWEYHNPSRRMIDDKEYVPIMNSALRFSAEAIDFDFNGQ